MRELFSKVKSGLVSPDDQLESRERLRKNGKLRRKKFNVNGNIENNRMV